jgi:hypothetical protein
VTGSFDGDGRPEWGDGLIFGCWGKKKSGKSILGRYLFSLYAGDGIVIASNGDDGPFADGRIVHLMREDAETMPRRWPEHLRHERDRLILRFEFDAGSATFLEDQDAAVGLALAHGDTCLLVHETHLMAPVAASRRQIPHMHRLLAANRHAQVGGGRGRVSAIFCGPRPAGIQTLILAQSDVTYLFELPVPADRARLAEQLGVPPTDLGEALDDLLRHEYLRYDANEHKPEGEEPDLRLLHMPPLPADIVKSVQEDW